MTLTTKRAYEKAATKDGKRVLVDRIWPRGVSKEEAKLYDWLKEIGPSDELRQWFDHDRDKYEVFKQKYKEELKTGDQKEALKKLEKIVKDHKKVTLIFGAKEEKYNQATVLQELLENS